jgi:hypothetical protein
LVEANTYLIKKALVSLAIEKTLIEMSNPALETVSNKLFEYYHCYVPDCFEHPEYLKRVLKELFGNSYDTIIKSIESRLEEFSSQTTIADFLVKISE